MTEPQDTSGAEILPSLFTASAPPSVRIEQFEVEEAPSLERARFSRKRYLHFTAICWVFFVNGWNDGTTGPLLPKIQEYYHIGFAVVSLIFIFNCVGYIIGVLANVHLTDRLGLGKVLVLGSCLQLVAYAMQSPGGPYPLMVVAYAIGGCGLALQNAQGTGFVGSFDKHDHVFMGVLQASYGLGAFTAPLVATHFASSRHWSFHFLISAGLAISNTVSLLAVFRLRNQDDVMAEAGQAPGEVGTASGSKYSQMMGLRSLHLLAAFALIYVGTEVTLGGWIVTYVIKERAGGTSAGYISSGFFGGMTVGRVALIWLNRLVGERRILYIYIVLAIALEMTVWLVPSLLQNALAISAIGVLLGPMYPILVGQASRILPRWLLTGALGWIAGVGQAGSALLPFITGVLAAQYGIASLQPLLIVMMVSLIGLWAIIPKDHRRVD